MIVNMQAGATDDQIEHVIERVKECGFQAHVIRGAKRTVIGASETMVVAANSRRCWPRRESRRWSLFRIRSSW